MNEKFNKNAKVEQLNKMFLGRGEEKGLFVKGPLLGDVGNGNYITGLVNPPQRRKGLYHRSLWLFSHLTGARFPRAENSLPFADVSVYIIDK